MEAAYIEYDNKYVRSLFVENMSRQQIPFQVDNPTNEDRYEQLRFVLTAGRRPEDFENIISILSPPKDIREICSGPCGKGVKVAVIGAGAAGLAAAFELKKIGCDITVFEANERIGGRIYTYPINKGYNVDLGAERIPVSHETSWHYINLFNLNTRPFATSNINGLYYIRGERATKEPSGISVMENIYPQFNLPPEEAKAPWRELSGRLYDKYILGLSAEIRKELIQVKENYAEEIRQMDRMNYKAGYESVGLSENAIFMIGYLSTLDVEFFNLSLAEMMDKVYSADFSQTYYLEGGAERIITSFYNALTNKNLQVFKDIDEEELGQVKIRVSTAIDGIYQDNNKDKVTLKCRATKDKSITLEEFDYVICAIPFTSLRRVEIKPVFSLKKMQAINELNYEASQKTFLFLKDRFWEMGEAAERIVGGSSGTDLPIINIIYPSDHAIPVEGKSGTWTLRPGASPNSPGALLASYNWGQDAEIIGNEANNLRIRDIARQVEEVHGLEDGYIRDRLLSWVTMFWANAQYIWSGACFGKPQDRTLFSYAVTLPEMNNRVYFAGEHISQKHAWIQGALQSAMLAANSVAEAIAEK